jgi:hypothetical protein
VSLNLLSMNDSLTRRRQRVKLIRNRVVAGAVALFVAVFGGITAQLAAGKDPALSSSKTTATTSAATSTTTQQKQDTNLTPVTTQQS